MIGVLILVTASYILSTKGTFIYQLFSSGLLIIKTALYPDNIIYGTNVGPIWASIWALHGQPIWYPHGFCKRYFDGPSVGFNVGPTWATRGPIWVPYGNSTWDPYLYNINRYLFNCILIFLIERI